MIYIIFAVLFVIIFGLSLYSRRFNNPNKLYFLFGKKGSGKSTYMVKLMLKDIKDGWNVYTNLPDVKINGIRVFDVNDLSKCAPDKHSALYIDEGGLIWDKRNFKSFSSGLTEFFALQRKYGCKMVINSQSYDVDLKIRDRVDGMYLQSNIGNIIGITRPIKRSVTLTEPSAEGESRIADKLIFESLWHYKITWLPRYFKYFDSFTAPPRDSLPYKVIEV